MLVNGRPVDDSAKVELATLLRAAANLIESGQVDVLNATFYGSCFKIAFAKGVKFRATGD